MNYRKFKSSLHALGQFFKEILFIYSLVVNEFEHVYNIIITYRHINQNANNIILHTSIIYHVYYDLLYHYNCFKIFVNTVFSYIL